MIELRRVNKEYRANDESHLWPICGKFNATERAIRKARYIRRETGDDHTSYGRYPELLDALLSEIVNAEV